jgi:hypothetical protein
MHFIGRSMRIETHMRIRWMPLLLSSFLLPVLCVPVLCGAQDQEEGWLGVWQSKLDGQTAVVVTLADDAGRPGGTVVLNIVRSQGGEARIVGSEPLLLMHARLNQRTLTFELKSPRPPDNVMEFTMVLNPDGTATIHCTSCNGAPLVKLTKEW